MPYLAILLVFGSTGLHATWNLLAHIRSRDGMLFARMCLWITVFGSGPVLLGILVGQSLPMPLWGAAAASGMCLAVYFFGLSRGYRVGDFTLVYPLARALPILLLAAFDLARGHSISLTGALGIFVVVAGCMLLTTNSRSRGTRHESRSVWLWVGVIAMGTVGYSSIDKLAMESIADRHWMVAAQYGCVQFAMAWPVLHLSLKRMAPAAPTTDVPAGRSVVMTIAALNLTSYVLILLAYQLVDQVSYVVALRQFSIVLGAMLGAWVLRESSPRVRIAAAACIALGVMMIVLAMG